MLSRFPSLSWRSSFPVEVIQSTCLSNNLVNSHFANNTVTYLPKCHTPSALFIRHVHNPLMIRGKGRKPGPTRKERRIQEARRIEENKRLLEGHELITKPLIIPPKHITAPLYSLQFGRLDRTISLSPQLFAAPLRPDIVHRVVVWQRAAMRIGSAHSKSRSEVSGTGRKPHPQKGTGRARQGTRRAPHHVGGGVAHGPKHRDFSFALPKKIRTFGVRVALTAKFQEGNLIIVEDALLAEHSSMDFKNILQTHFGGIQSYLLIHSDSYLDINNNTILATRSFQRIDYLPAKGANVLDIIRHPTIFITKAALVDLGKRVAKSYEARNVKIRFMVGKDGAGLTPSQFQQQVESGQIQLPRIEDFPLIQRKQTPSQACEQEVQQDEQQQEQQQQVNA